MYVYALMTRTTRDLYRAVFPAMHNLVPEFITEHVMAEFGRHPLLLFRKYSAINFYEVI